MISTVKELEKYLENINGPKITQLKKDTRLQNKSGYL